MLKEEGLARMKPHLLPQLDLESPEGRPVSTARFAGRHSLVAAFLEGDGCAACLRLLEDLAGQYRRIQEEQAKALAIVSGGPRTAANLRDQANPPFPVLADAHGEARRAVERAIKERLPHAAVLLADRFGEIYWLSHADRSGHPGPVLEELLGWLDYLGLLCPEQLTGNSPTQTRRGFCGGGKSA